MLLASGVLLAVVMTGWVAVDAARRGRNWLAWAMLTALTGGIGLAVWLFARRRVPAQARLRPTVATAIFLSAIPLVFLSVCVIAFVVNFAVQPAQVYGNAMAPTLVDRDRVMLDKWVYRTREARSGEIVAFHYPLRPDRIMVLRVIAEQGGSGPDRERARTSERREDGRAVRGT